MKPYPWSHSSLDDFINCPRSYHEKRVLKSVKEEQSEQMIWGNFVHKAFELRIKDGTELPEELQTHEPLMLALLDKPGVIIPERKVALSEKGIPCGFFDKDVWHRGVIDVSIVDNDRAEIWDYKTGKPHSKFKQLKINALHVFCEFPDVQAVTVKYYWTKTETTTGETYTREMVPRLWGEFLPDLRQYKQAFNNDTWQPRPSGLCNGWCPVIRCEHWKPKRKF